MLIRKCTVCGGNFEVDNNYIYINVCPECQAIDEPRMKKEIADLIDRIENVWREYRNLQDQYRKLTGRDYEWLR
jgi:hypothetical protein